MGPAKRPSKQFQFASEDRERVVTDRITEPSLAAKLTRTSINEHKRQLLVKGGL